jgi:hypothetical protein
MEKPPPPPAQPKGGARPKDARGDAASRKQRTDAASSASAKKPGKTSSIPIRQGRLKLIPDPSTRS